MNAENARLLLNWAGERALEASSPTDSDLLTHFVRYRDEAAFELLVRRHGAMVHRVCRTRLIREADADDVFQAVFLALARGAGRIRAEGSLAGWLHRVAIRMANRFRIRNRISEELPQNHTAVDGDPARITADREHVALLFNEIDRLPGRYRDVVLLCLIEGKTRGQAARELKCPGGTIDSRLAWARQRLRVRLKRFGLAPAVIVALTEPLAAQSTSARLVASTCRMALAENSATIAPATLDLIQHTGTKMISTKSRFAIVFAISLGVLGVFTQKWLDRPEAAEPPKSANVSRSDPTGESEWRHMWSARLGQTPVTNLLFLPDAKTLIANGGKDANDSELGFLDMATGKLKSKWKLEPPMRSAAISPDGKWIATAEAHGRAVLRFTDSGKISESVGLFQERVQSLAFSPDGKVVALGANDGSVRIWNPVGPGVPTVKQLSKQTGAVDSLSFTPDGKRLFSAGDGTIRIWDAASGKLLSEEQEWGRGKREIATSPDGLTLAIARPTHVSLIDSRTGKTLRTIQFPSDGLHGDKDICSVAYLPDGKQIAVVCNPYLSAEPNGVGEVRVIDVATGTPRATLRSPSGLLVKVVASPDGRYLVAGGHDGVVHVWQRNATSTQQSIPTKSDRFDKLIAELADSKRTNEQCVESLFLAALGRFPNDTERKFVVDHVSKSPNRVEGLNDVFFQLTNSREFHEHVGQLQSRGAIGPR